MTLLMNECDTADALRTAERWKQRLTGTDLPPTLGVELELQIVDRDTGRLKRLRMQLRRVS
jgi:hypothetical protein